RLETEPELVLEPDRPQEAERIVLEDLGPDGAEHPSLEVGAPVERIDVVAAGQRAGDRVDREVAAREGGPERSPERRGGGPAPPCWAAPRLAPGRWESGKGAPAERCA